MVQSPENFSCCSRWPKVRFLLACFWFVLIGFAAFSPSALAQKDASAAGESIDQYFDQRNEPDPQATTKLLDELSSKFDIKSPAQIESLLRQSRVSYPDASDWIGQTTEHEVVCDHVSYESTFLMFVPESYDARHSSSLVIVGHGGNSSMSEARAASVANMYLRAYAPIMSRELNAIVVAPVSTRGWGHIGNSLILSTISKVKRMLSIDPDRIYITGQSMGGHLSYRSALTLADRWGAVSPQSGGYDFVAKGTIGNLLNVPGYVTWGQREPYGIDKDNRTNAKWGKTYGLDWVFVEKDGGHSIYQDELPKVAKFFADHPRDLYRDRVYFHQGGEMKFLKTWEVKGWPEHEIYHETRPLRWNLTHWLDVTPHPDLEGPITVLARNRGGNRIELTSHHARQLKLYLHPNMVDFDKDVTVVVNGDTIFAGDVDPDPQLMLELAREFDDRGRVFWAALELEINSDQAVELPKANVDAE